MAGAPGPRHGSPVESLPRSECADPPEPSVEVPPAGGHRVLRGGARRPGTARPAGRVHVDDRRARSPGGRRAGRRGIRPARAGPGARSTRRPVAAPTCPCLVWLHGGAFRMGDLDMPEADWTARQICERADAVVVSVDYRLCNGGVTYPVPHDDVVAAVRWVRDNAVAAGRRRRPDLPRRRQRGRQPRHRRRTEASRRRTAGCPPRCCSPTRRSTPSSRRRRARWRRCWTRSRRCSASSPRTRRGITENYLGGPASRADGYAMPANAVLEGLCPVLLINSEYDDLRASAEVFAGQLDGRGRRRPPGGRPGHAARLPEPARRRRAGRRGAPA